MRQIRFAAFAVATIVWSAVAGAQIASQMSGSSTDIPLNNVQPFSELQGFGQCFVSASRGTAIALIATIPGSSEEREIFRRRIGGEQPCMAGGTGTRMGGSLVYFRGAIAEALMRSRVDLPASYMLDGPAVAQVHSIHDAARCYASRHRAEARAVLDTAAGSPQERAAVAGIWNDFRACIPEDVNGRMTATWIRFLLAEALLRLPEAATAATAQRAN